MLWGDGQPDHSLIHAHSGESASEATHKLFTLFVCSSFIMLVVHSMRHSLSRDGGS